MTGASAVHASGTSGFVPAFAEEEFDARVSRVREAMDEQGIGALLVASPEDIYYLAGLDHAGHFAFTLLVLPLEGRPVLVAREMERPTVKVQTPGCDFAAYRDDEDPAQAVIAAIRGLEPAVRRIGVQRSTMSFPVDVWERIRWGSQTWTALTPLRSSRASAWSSRRPSSNTCAVRQRSPIERCRPGSPSRARA